MSIVFTEEVAGVIATDRNYSQYYTKSFGGFVQYVQKISPTVKNIGVIHYTNNSPSNNYGESLNGNTPILELPTIMWHYETGNTIGLQLKCGSVENILPELNTRYYDLVDKYGNILGKVFNDLKLFVIEDQELLFAMSYKANRNWTLPPVKPGINLVLCPPCALDFISIVGANPTTIGGTNGFITISVSGGTGNIVYTINNGVPQVLNSFNNLSNGTYIIDVYDEVCVKSAVVILSDPDSLIDVNSFEIDY
jgi:hypothetical protein